MPNNQESAKLVMLLSSCFKVSEGVIKVMTEQYVKSKTLATRHYFVFYINFFEPSSDSNFDIENVYNTFLNTDDKVLLDALQYHNNSILNSAEMSNICNNLIKANIKLSEYQKISVYSIATLIKLHRKKYFSKIETETIHTRYIFIPVIINYGRDNRLLHQTALIIDISQEHLKFIYYEPYGLYKKYDKSYKTAVKKLFECFNGFMGDKIIYTTYHDMLDLTNLGIQQIIMDANNARSGDFELQLSKLIKELNTEFPNENFTGNNNNPEANDESDKTLKVLDTLFKLDRFNIDNLSDEKKNIYFRCLNTILKQYCCFNSKTCVSITIVELNKFFQCSQEFHHNLSTIKEKMKEYNTQYKNNETPNNILMEEIYKMIDLFKHSKKIKEIIGEQEQVYVICDNLQNDI